MTVSGGQAGSRVLVGDCVELMAGLEAGSVDAIVTDPPYGIRFMGKAWDGADIVENARKRGDGKAPTGARGRTLSAFNNEAGSAGAYDFSLKGNRAFQEWCEAWAREALRVLKPGGHLLAFGGTRTYHRLVCAVEDAGFEIRDTIRELVGEPGEPLLWLYGSGFPKSADPILGMRSLPRSTTREAYCRWHHAVRTTATGTALKPAHEPIVVARKPLAGTVAGNVLEHGTGALNIDGCRVEGQPDSPGTTPPTRKHDGRTFEGGELTRVPYDVPSGRWPANVVLDEEAAQLLDEQSGETPRGGGIRGRGGTVYGDGRGYTTDFAEVGQSVNYRDSGGASRFFYCAKASRAERNAGLDGFEERDAAIQMPPNATKYDRRDGQPGLNLARRNHHPTVKPISLMRWLTRLVTPPGGLVADLFTGSGTTGIAAQLEGFRFLGLERDPEYAAIAQARIRFWAEHGEDGLRIVAERERAEEKREAVAASGQLDLLGGAA